MNVQSRTTICLIGPTSSGKTSLLATLMDCIEVGAHGYPPGSSFVISETAEAEFTGDGTVPQPRILNAYIGDYEKLRRRFGSPYLQATPTDSTYAYFFSLEARLPWEPPGSASTIRLQIVDAAGEIAIAQDSGEKDISPEVKERFNEQICEADALIFAIPLVNLPEATWTNSVSSLMTRVANYGGKKLRRVVVAFTQYERLFVGLGPKAFSYAVDPKVVLHILRSCLYTAPWLNQLRSLEMQAPAVNVRFTVTSAFGFVRKYDNPNIDPHQDGQALFRVGGRHAILWRPFLTAEPFLWAATGEDTVFTASYASLNAEESSEPLQESPSGAQSLSMLARSGKTWLQRVSRTMVDAIDVNRR
jgi:hypothetical protein